QKTLEFIDKLEKRHPGRYTILSEYRGGYHEIEYTCNLCGNKYLKAANYIYRKNVGCNGCKNDKFNNEWFEKKVYDRLDPNEYELMDEYINSRKPVRIRHIKCNYIYNL